MLVTVYSPKNKLFDRAKVTAVSLPGEAGDMQILNNHIPVIATLRPGLIVLENKKGEKENIHVEKGYIQFADNKMTIVVVDTKLSDEELQAIEDRAISMKDSSVRGDDISEEEFFEMEESESKG
jgi:F-type H+-transporting ATPase subunit epsilon